MRPRVLLKAGAALAISAVMVAVAIGLGLRAHAMPVETNVREGIVSLPAQPGTTAGIHLAWSPSGRTILAALTGTYVEKRGLLVTTQEGPMAHAYFIIDASGGAAKPFLRARDCRFLPDGRILALSYAPFDTAAEDILGISLSPDREKNTKAAGLFTATGEFLKDAPAAFAGIPSPDGKRFLDSLEPDGRNNSYCFRKLVTQAENEEPAVLSPPVAQKPGRLVGFTLYGWHGNDAIRASVVDMDERQARTAVPGMWRTGKSSTFEYSLRTRAWTPLNGEQEKEALNRGVNVEGGTLYVMDDAIKLVRGAETKLLKWPELAEGEVDLWQCVFSPDGVYGVIQVRTSSRGAPGFGGADPSGAAVDGALGAPAAAPAAEKKPPLGLWLIDMSKLSKTRLAFPDEKGDPDTAGFEAMGWVGGGSFALIQLVARTTVNDARGTVITDHKGGSYYLHAATGKIERFSIDGIPWQPFRCERSARGKDAVAVLVRPGPGNPMQQEFRVAVVRAKGDARYAPSPGGFRVGYFSGLWFSPDGRTLVVSETNGRRLWFVGADKGD